MKWDKEILLEKLSGHFVFVVSYIQAYLYSRYLVFPVSEKGQELFWERSNGILAASELNVLVGATGHCVAGERYVLLLLALVLFSSLSTSS